MRKIEMRRCRQCRVIKPATPKYFNRNKASKGGILRKCKECSSEYHKKWYQNNRNDYLDYRKEYYENNKESISIKTKAYKEKNKEYYKEYMKAYKKENREELLEKNRKYYEENKDRFKEYQKRNRKRTLQWQREYREKNRERIREYNRKYNREYKKERLKTDPAFRIQNNLQRRMLHALKGSPKSDRSRDLIGCSNAFLQEHIEIQFLPGMTWENYGEWQIDHIIPCASFDLTKPEEQMKCFHYSNLQPLWAVDNIRKSDKVGIDAEQYI